MSWVLRDRRRNLFRFVFPICLAMPTAVRAQSVYHFTFQKDPAAQDASLKERKRRSPAAANTPQEDAARADKSSMKAPLSEPTSVDKSAMQEPVSESKKSPMGVSSPELVVAASPPAAKLKTEQLNSDSYQWLVSAGVVQLISPQGKLEGVALGGQVRFNPRIRFDVSIAHTNLTGDFAKVEQKGYRDDKIDSAFGFAMRLVRFLLPSLDSGEFTFKAGVMTQRNVPDRHLSPYHLEYQYEIREPNRLLVPYWGVGFEINFTPRSALVTEARVQPHPENSQVTAGIAVRF